MKQTIELLAPAKNLECGMAAIDHGADAVYIGATQFGARQAAGNNVEDIRQLCEYAHRFGARVHVTVNTIIYEDELNDMLLLIDELAKAGVDALLIQDMGLFSECRKRYGNKFALHASTQCDTRTPEKAAWLHALGFNRVVLARELSVKEIAAIHQVAPDMELEVFVHGALCVSYSGICYASQHCFGRSANRGACAQFCRMAFDLKDANGKLIEQQRYLLSLKDMCQIDNLESLMRSGACSFKIEGRLKDVNYVKNVVAAYNQRLNDIIAKHPQEFQRASYGKVDYSFTPNLNKTFNRGYTDYFANGRQKNIFSPNTPKAPGEFVGTVKEVRRDSFNVSGLSSFANGDGLCFICKPSADGGAKAVLEGFRVNRVVGNRLFPYKMPQALRAGTALYRNQDQAFEKILSGKTAERRIPISMRLGVTRSGYSLSVSLSANIGKLTQTCAEIELEHQKAEKPQRKNILRQLSKLGDTIYVCEELKIEDEVNQYFIPSSWLAKLRRKAIERLSAIPLTLKPSGIPMDVNSKANKRAADFTHLNPSQYRHYPYLYNISNSSAASFYERQGMIHPDKAFECLDEKKNESSEPLLMQCRHCIRYSLGYCVSHGGKKPTWKEPLYLELGDKRRFRLEFDCKACQMNIYAL